jgi:hypothetical protein
VIVTVNLEGAAAEATEATEATEAVEAAEAAEEREGDKEAPTREAEGVKEGEDADEKRVVVNEVSNVVELPVEVEMEIMVVIGTRASSRVLKSVSVDVPVEVESVVTVAVGTRQETVPVTSLEIESKLLDPAVIVMWLQVGEVSLPHCHTR